MSSLVADLLKVRKANLEVLAQSIPGANSLEDGYTVPGSTSTIVTGLKVCNQDGVVVRFRVSIGVAGEADHRKQYQYFDVPLEGNDTLTQDEEWTLGPGDVVRFYSDSGGVSFTLFGAELATP